MRCTNPQDLYLEISGIVMTELRMAVKAHGGLVRFEDDARPAVIHCKNHRPETILVCQVSLNDDDQICVTAVAGDDPAGLEIEFPIEDILSPDILTRAIPETKAVSDVTVQTRGALDVDPQIVIELMTNCVGPLTEAGLEYSDIVDSLISQAKRLTLLYRETDWHDGEHDFWLTMESEAEKVIRRSLALREG